MSKKTKEIIISKAVLQLPVNSHLLVPVFKSVFFYQLQQLPTCQMQLCFPMATDSCPKWWNFHIDNWKVSQITAKSTWSLISHLNIQKEFFLSSHVKRKLFIYLTTDGMMTAKLSTEDLKDSINLVSLEIVN